MRRPRAGDLAEVAALAAAVASAGRSTPDLSATDLETQWRRPGFDLKRDAWLVRRAAGRLSAYASLRARRAQDEAQGAYLIRPNDRDERLEGYLIDLLESRARELADEVGDSPRPHFALRCARDDRDRRRLCLAHGLHRTHAFQRMTADIADLPALPPWPTGIRVHTLDPDREARAVHAALTEVFAGRYHEDPGPFDEWRRQVFSSPHLDPALWFVAWDGDQVAATALAIPEPDNGYVDDLAVRPAWRGLGLGAALLVRTLEALRDRGYSRAVLDVRRGSRAARLYRRFGFDVERVIDYFEKPLLGAGDTQT